MKNWSDPGNASPPQTFYQGTQPPPPPQWPPVQAVYQPVPAVQAPCPPPPPDPRKIYNRWRRREYNSMGLALLAQLGISLAVTFLLLFGVIFLIVFSKINSGALNPNYFDVDDIYGLIPLWLIPLVTVLAYLPANMVTAVVFSNRAGLDIADMFRPKSATVLVVLGGAAVCMTANVAGSLLMQLVNAILSPVGLELTTPDFALEFDTAGNLLMLLYTVIIAPVTEELLFRGLLLRVFQRTGRTFAIVASALLFAMVHGNLLQTVPAFLMGLVLGYVAMRCGSILPAILIHLLNNGYVMLFQVLEEPLGDVAVWIEYGVLFICLIGAIAALIRERKQFSVLRERKAPKGSWGLFFSSWALLVTLAIYAGVCLLYVGPLAV